MFYNLKTNDFLELETTIARIEQKLLVLKDLNDQKSINKAKHLSESKSSLQKCLDKKDDDKFDFFMHQIYTLTWGTKLIEEMSEDGILPCCLKVDKEQE
ncbi:hypothetical protein ABM514_002065, partial [Campylobacter coli]|nr:hypothetical protein [Campylobacter coli]